MAARRSPAKWLAFQAAAASLGLAFMASPAKSQTFLPDPLARPGLALQFEKPFLPDVEGLASYSSNLEVDAILPLGSRAALQLGLPFAFAGADVVDGTSVYVGNLRASLLFGDPGKLSGFVGVTLPTASNIGGPDLAVIVAVLPWLDEVEKWADDAYSVRGAWIPSKMLKGGGRTGLRVGGAAVAPNDFENLFVYTRLAAWGRIPVGAAELRGDLATSYIVNSDDGFGQQFTAYLDLGAALTGTSGRPGAFIRIPLDGDAREALDVSIGLMARF